MEVNALRYRHPVNSIIGFVLLFALVLPGCGVRESSTGESSGSTVQSIQGRTMGTTYHIAHDPPSSKDWSLPGLHEAIGETLDRVVRMASTYDPESEVSRFNAHASCTPFPISRELAQIVGEALSIARETGGAYDPTVLPLVRLFGFGPKEVPILPGPEAIQGARTVVGYRHLRLDASGSLIKSNPLVEMDLSGIAKGYAVDRVGAVLTSAGCRNWMVEIGGEVRTSGRKPGGKMWKVGIEVPLEDTPFGSRIHRTLSLQNAALATSGDYRNFKKAEGKRWHHIVDPRTGTNPTHDLASVTIRADSCARADALATGVMVMGQDEGMALIEGIPGIEALFIRRLEDGTFATATTTGF